MEEEITPAVATNGVANNGEEGALTASGAPLSVVDAVASTNEWERGGAVELANEEEAASAAVAGDNVYMNEGNVAPNAGEGVEAIAANAEEGAEVQEEEEEEMGEAEYLDDAMPDDDGDDENPAEEETTADKNNTTNAETEKPTDASEAVAESVAEEGSANNVATDAEALEEAVEEDVEEEEAVEEEIEEEDDDEEGELITGDDAQEQLKTAGDATDKANVSARSGAQKQEEPVDENQCRVCTSKDNLKSLFTKTSDSTTPADMLLLICPSVSIAPKDFMPQFICNNCQQSLTIAIKLRKQLETTEKDLRKRLSRSKNKIRRPRGYVVIDAPVSDSASDEDEEELNDDAEFKVSDVAGSTSPDSDSADSDISEKRKPGRRRGRKKKRSAGSEEEYPQKKKSLMSQPALPAQGPFECDQCDQSFPRKQSYVMHRKTHDPRHEYLCQICNKQFKVRGAYKTHMERHDSERAQFRCELCAQVFRLRAELKRHMGLSHDEHGVIYECKRCQRTFLTQQRLQRHQSTSCIRHSETKVRRMESHPSQGRDLFKSVAPLTTTYWSDSFSD
ncbi:zinc finger protein 316 [Drosophila sulfurigaster albostrigata]|uniref:zinc finger protein 316 n=1 Tax=Drosophila sulfurigaster albostrigata TaxID=89887 RepID=UPI002D219417|nr:zinc finger protein 316 [Drosophila sulfurigaster albostrigata]